MRVLPLIVLWILDFAVVNARATSWEERAPLPRGVAGHAAAVADGTLWIAGGSYWDDDVKQIERAIRRRTAEGKAWQTVSMLPRGFAHGGWATDAGALWLAGGFDESGPTAAVWRIDLNTGAARQIARLPEARAYCGAVLFEGALWVVGGVTDASDFSRTHATCLTVDLATGNVRTEAAAGPPFVNPLVLALGGELHVLPGSLWSEEDRRLEAPSDVWIWSPVRRGWRQRPLAAPVARGLSGASLDRSCALLVGGAESRDGIATLARAAWIYDAGSGALTVGPALPASRLAAAVVADVTSIWILGGEDRARSRAASVWRLRVATLANPAR